MAVKVYSVSERCPNLLDAEKQEVVSPPAWFGCMT
jgi:hypothetical protein